jgi:hypothetical protein
MTGPRCGVLLRMGMLLLALLPAAPSLALSSQAHGRRSVFGLPLLDIAQLQRDADYTRGGPNAYFNPTYGLIALGIGALFGLAWLFGGEPFSRLRGDPVPSRIRNRLDRLDSTRLTIFAAVRAARARRPDTELAEEKALYDRLAADAGEVLDKARQDLLLNLVDESFLVPALDGLNDRAQSLSFRLRRIAPVGSPARNGGIAVEPAFVGFSRINRGWERVFSAESPKMATVRQLRAMHWPSWSRIDVARRPPE